MQAYFFLRKKSSVQFLISIGLVCATSLLCFSLSAYIGYRIVALILLVTVSLLAMFLDILPVLTAALLSALVWNYFFIPPKFTFRIGSPEDFLMFSMYFVIATINAVLTYKIRQMEKENIKKEEKERTIRLYNTILNSLSHELRTPISTLIGASDTLLNSSALSEKNKSDLFMEISTASLRLNHQVENLLNMSRLESGFLQPKKDWTDISELIYDALKRIELDKIQQKVTVLIDPKITLFRLDKLMMEEVIYNLVRNAVLYTPDTSSIYIRAKNVNGQLELIIEDNGPGFPESEVDKVFDKFYRLKNSRAGGTGLGLSIVKGFVMVHNGTVTLENLPSGGARFLIRIPAESSAIQVQK